MEEEYHPAADRAVLDFNVLVHSDIDAESRMRIPQVLPLVHDSAMHNNAFVVHRILLQQLYQEKKAEKLKKLNVKNVSEVQTFWY